MPIRLPQMSYALRHVADVWPGREVSGWAAMVDIRSPTVADAPGVAAVQVGNYRHDYAPLFPPGYWDGVTVEEQTQDWDGWLDDHPGDVLLVAEAGAEVVGSVLARVHPYHGAQAQVMALHVGPPARGQGHGKALLRAVVQHLNVPGVGRSTLEGHPIRAWYAALGGQQIATIPDSLPMERGGEVIVYLWPEIRTLLDALA